MLKSELVVFASASEVTYPAVLSNGTRIMGSGGGGNGKMQPGVPDMLSGTTASEIVPFGNRKRNEPCPRTVPPLTLMLAQPWTVWESELESTTFWAPLGGSVNI